MRGLLGLLRGKLRAQQIVDLKCSSFTTIKHTLASSLRNHHYPRKQPDYRSQTSFFGGKSVGAGERWWPVAPEPGRSVGRQLVLTFTEKHGHKEGCSTMKKGALSKNIIGIFRFGLSLIFFYASWYDTKNII